MASPSVIRSTSKTDGIDAARPAPRRRLLRACRRAASHWTVALVSVGGLAACASPGTPMKGMTEAASAEFARDVSRCKAYAATVDTVEQVADRVVGAAILAGTLAFALGGSRVEVNRVTAAGALFGAVSASLEVDARERRLFADCMVGRGHRTSPTADAVRPGIPSPATETTTLAVASDLAPPEQTGASQYQAFQFARQSGCHALPVVHLSQLEPGLERYTVTCQDGSTQRLQCTYGHCTQTR